MDKTQLAAPPAAAASGPRYAILDIARGIGILLVIYGHFLQSFIEPSAPLIFQQYLFIYSFHMPLFFILSGMVGQLSPGNKTGAFRKNLRGALELIALVIVMHVIGTGLDLLTRDQTLDWSTPEIFINGFRGGNAAIGVMWFLLCLGIVRLTVGSALLVGKLPLRIAALGGVLAVFAWHYHKRGQWPNWQDTTLVFGALFFLIGRLVPLRLWMRLAHPAGLLLAIPATLALAFYNQGCGFAFAYSHGPDAAPHCGGAVFDGLHPVIMMMGEYNNYLLFVAGALTGTLMCFGIANLFARARGPVAALTLIGQNTLGLLLVNALYCAFLLPLVQAHLPADGVDSLTLTASAIGLTLLHVLCFRFLKPATDGVTALSGWAGRSLSGMPDMSARA